MISVDTASEVERAALLRLLSQATSMIQDGWHCRVHVCVRDAIAFRLGLLFRSAFQVCFSGLLSRRLFPRISSPERNGDPVMMSRLESRPPPEIVARGRGPLDGSDSA